MNEEKKLESLEKLRVPFAESAISYLPKGGVNLAYIGHANLTDRLLSVDPFWSWEPFATDERGLPALDYDANGKAVGMWIKLTVCGVTRIGYGSCLPTKSDNVKELIGDALRNSGMRFGLALDLWAKADLESQHSDESPSQRPQPPQAPRAQQSPQQSPQRASNGANAANGANANGAAPMCPKCGKSAMFDNRAKKASGEMAANRPDFSCKDRECKGAIWPPRDNASAPARQAPHPGPQTSAADWATPESELELAFAQDAANGHGYPE